GSARVPHTFRVPSPGRFEHDADEAWRRGPQAALAALGDAAPRGVSVAAMVPSLTAVDGGGVPLTPGLLYGDERGRHELRTGHPVESGELLAFLRWTAGEAPDAAGYWPAQAVADADGDVLVILGTTLIVWAVTSREDPVPGHYVIPHSAPGRVLVGGPSNAGGLFLNWVEGLLAAGEPPTDPGRVPVWAPFPR